MRVYVATAFTNKEEARELMAKLVAAGHEITHDWTGEELDTSQPPEAQQEYLAKCARQDVRGVRDADAVVYINHPDARGALFELGLAYATGALVLVLHPERKDNIFWHLSSVQLLQSTEELVVLLATMAWLNPAEPTEPLFVGAF